VATPPPASATLGSTLAIGPLDITAIWPPSDIALAAFMPVIAPVALVFLHPACRPVRIAVRAFPIIWLGLGLTLC
jgi:hypothetical protein